HNGFLNSIFGQKDVTVTTEGWNYIAIEDDVYMYTGVTSVTSDESNIGFILSNQRTKETHFYSIAGAEEYSAKASAESQVQQMRYEATFPLLLNIGGDPTYFIPLKGAANLVKTYAMVNVARYDIAETGATVSDCERAYLRALANKGIEAAPGAAGTKVSGVIAEIRSAVMEGNTYYFLRLEGQQVFYSVSAAQNTVAVILNVGDTVTVEYAAGEAGEQILTGYTVTLDRKG
ncbi:MAG: CvpA family protein, partial [Oscillospiraceae bacterium]|nr:CvpA family protein [Oscillospiraceae bacterium]